MDPENKERKKEKKKSQKVYFSEKFNDPFVVYFEERTHACACVCMVENNEKHSKIMNKYLYYHAYKRLIKKNEEKSLLVQDWD